MTEANPNPDSVQPPSMPGPPAGYDAIGEAKRLLRATRVGSLCVIDQASGYPVATLVTQATDHDGAPILLLSQLSAHTRNLDADPRCSILLAQGGKGDPLAHPRVTIVGRAVKQTDPATRDHLKARFLRKNPKSALYANFGDFSFWRLEIAAAHLNGGFAKAADFDAAAILTRLDGAESLIEAEAGALDHMNADHPDTLALYATKLAREAAGRWRATGLDPEGIDLAAGDLAARVAFGRRVTSPGELRGALSDLAARARSTA